MYQMIAKQHVDDLDVPAAPDGANGYAELGIAVRQVSPPAESGNAKWDTTIPVPITKSSLASFVAPHMRFENEAGLG